MHAYGGVEPMHVADRARAASVGAELLPYTDVRVSAPVSLHGQGHQSGKMPT